MSLTNMKDKLEHFIVCAVLTIAGYHFLNLYFGLFLALIFAFGKEYKDSKTPGNRWDWFDLMADFLGILFAIGLLTNVII